MEKYNLKKYIEEMIFCCYYITLIIEDLINYYGFIIHSDKIIHDIRTVTMKNYYKNEFITVKSNVISYFDDKYKQYNEIYYIDKTNNEWIYKYIGKCHKNII